MKVRKAALLGKFSRKIELAGSWSLDGSGDSRSRDVVVDYNWFNLFHCGSETNCMVVLGSSGSLSGCQGFIRGSGI